MFNELLMLAYETLVIVINEKGTDGHENLEAYVFLKIRGELKNYVFGNAVVRCPNTRKIVAGDPTKESLVPMTVVPKTWHKPIIISLDGWGAKGGAGGTLEIGWTPPKQYDEFSIIDDLHLEPLDRVIVIKRLEGFTQEEIAQELEVDHSTITKRLNNIKELLRKIGIVPATEKRSVGKKVCSICEQEKSLDDFFVRTRHPLKHFGLCKVCFNRKKEPNDAPKT
jgi:hypothetical protein